MEIEINELVLRYAELRVVDRGAQSRLVASLTQEGQRDPVLVVADGDRYVLIDGYRRVAGLVSLNRDLVDAVLLPITEAEALLLRWRLERSRRRSVLEDAWLLNELMEAHDMGLDALSVRVGRSKSWVSRCLSLVRVLPEEAQDAVKRGIVPPHGAMKCLVPLARANVEHCQRLMAGLGKVAVTDRQVLVLYLGWKRGDEQERERIVEQPHLYLKVEEAVTTDAPEDTGMALVGDFEGISRLCHRARRRIREGELTPFVASDRKRLARTWHETQLSFVGLKELMTMEEQDAGHGNTDSGVTTTP